MTLFAWLGRFGLFSSPPEFSSAGRCSGPDTPDNFDPASAPGSGACAAFAGRRLRPVLAAALLAVALLGGLTPEAAAQAPRDTTPPVLANAHVTLDGVTLVLNWSEHLQPNSIPPASAFRVTVGSERIEVRGDGITPAVQVRGSRVQLRLSRAVTGSEAVRLGYSPPAHDPQRYLRLRDLAGNEAAGLSNRTVRSLQSVMSIANTDPIEVHEGHEGIAPGRLTVLLSNPRPVATPVPLTVIYPGNANDASPSDHGVTSGRTGQFRIPAGETRWTFDIHARDDWEAESYVENFTIAIDAASLDQGVTVGSRSQVSIVIYDDELELISLGTDEITSVSTILVDEDDGHVDLRISFTSFLVRDTEIRLRYDDLFTHSRRDYIQVPRVIAKRGENHVYARIPIVNDDEYETQELFRIYVDNGRRVVDPNTGTESFVYPEGFNGGLGAVFVDVIILDDDRPRGHIERERDGRFWCEGPVNPHTPAENLDGYNDGDDRKGTIGDGTGFYDTIAFTGGPRIFPPPLGGIRVEWDQTGYQAGDTAKVTVRTEEGDRTCSHVSVVLELSSMPAQTGGAAPAGGHPGLKRTHVLSIGPGGTQASLSVPLEAEGDVTFRVRRVAGRKARVGVEVPDPDDPGQMIAVWRYVHMPVYIGPGSIVEDPILGPTYDPGTAYTADFPEQQVSVGPATSMAQAASPPTLTLAADAAQVTEGGEVSFTISAEEAPKQDVEVTVGADERMGAGGDAVESGRVETIWLRAGQSSVKWTFTAYSDDEERADGAIEARIVADQQGRYEVGDSSTATMALIDDDGTGAIPDDNAQPLTAGLSLPGTVAAGLSNGVVTVARPSGWTGSGRVQFGGGAKARDRGRFTTLRIENADADSFEVRWASRDAGTLRLTLEWQPVAGSSWQPSDGGARDPRVLTIEDPAPAQPAAIEPSVTIAADTSPVTEGGDAVFTLTANPAPASPLAVTVVVAADGDYGISAGSRTVTVPTVGSFTLTLTTTDDGTDEPDGSASVTVEAGNGYTVGSPASGTVAIRDDDLPPPAVSIAAKTAAITEGGNAVFTITADRAPDVDLAVNIAVSESGDHVAAQHEGAVTTTILKGKTSVEITVPTVDDSADEPDGTVTAVLKGGSGYTLSNASSAQVSVADNDAASLPMVSVDDATAREGETMQFAVRLSAPLDSLVWVRLETRESVPASARAVRDFENVLSGEVMLFPGQTVAQFGVYLYDDSHDDGGETFEVHVLSASDGVGIADAVAVGTIENDDPLPAAWLARFGRTVAQQALDGIAERLAAPREAGMQGSIAGQALSPSTGSGQAFGPGDGDASGPGDTAVALAGIARGFDRSAQGLGAADPFGPGGASGFSAPQGYSLAMQSRTMTGHEALLGSRFTLSGEGSGGSLAFWGRASQSGFDGQEAGDGGLVRLDGEVTTGMLGADYGRGAWLVGLALTHSVGDGGYRDDAAAQDGPTAGRLEASLTAVLPYAAWRAAERFMLWGVVGYGAGRMTLRPDGLPAMESDLDWQLAAPGLRSELYTAPSGARLALFSDALWVQTGSARTGELSASGSEVTRLRLGLEGSWAVRLSGGGVLSPRLETGVRHDGGDAETGFGWEVGGALAWRDARLGLSLEVEGRALLTHESSDFGDWGVSGSLRFDPTPASERGLSASLVPSWGRPSLGGVGSLLEGGAASGLPGSEWLAMGGGGRLDAEVSYGLAVWGGQSTGTPYLGLGMSDEVREARLGWRMGLGPAEGVKLGIEGMRRERMADDTSPEHGVMLRLAVQ